MTTREDIVVGESFSFEHKFSHADEKFFEELTGDRTFLEDEGGRIVHGMLAAALFSALIDEHCPFGDNLYVHQTLNFRKPIHFGSRGLVRGTIASYNPATYIADVHTEIIVDGSVALDGDAKIRLVSP